MDMRNSVKMLLKRMSSHPEEFEYYTMAEPTGRLERIKKWDWFIQALLNKVNGEEDRLGFLSGEETSALYNKLLEIQEDSFGKRVMFELINSSDHKCDLVKS